MVLLRVDTYEGELASVEVKLAASPYTTVGTFVSPDVVAIEGGAYTVDVGAVTGQWMLLLRDSSSNVLGIKYASDQSTQSMDFPPWTNLSQISIVIDAAITALTPEKMKRRTLYFRNFDPCVVPVETFDLDDVPTDLTGVVLDFVIQNKAGTNIVEVLNVDGGDSTTYVTLPSITNQDVDDCFTWSLRVSGTNEVVGYGPAVYNFVPKKV